MRWVFQLFEGINFIEMAFGDTLGKGVLNVSANYFALLKSKHQAYNDRLISVTKSILIDEIAYDI